MPNVQRWSRAMTTDTFHYRLHHNADSHYMRGFARGDRLLRGYRGSVEVPARPEGHDLLGLCSLIFARHNHDDRPDGQQAPSLSIGDVIEVHVGGMRWDAYTVEPVGFRKVSMDEAKYVPGATYLEQAALVYERDTGGGDAQG